MNNLPPALTAFGGVAEIGGNKILLEDGDLRLMLDFGKAFGRYESYFDGVFIKERAGRGLLDLLSLGLLPPLRGFLREDLIPFAESPDAFWQRWSQASTFRDLRRDCAPPVDAILFTHAHQDHIGEAAYVDVSIQAVSSRLTAAIAKVLVDTAQDSQGVPYCARKKANEGGGLEAQRGDRVSRPWYFTDGEMDGCPGDGLLESARGFWDHIPGGKNEPLQKMPANAIPQVSGWAVDHSLLGAQGFAIQTSVGWLGYTGDLRFHGREGQASRRFAEQLAALQPVGLLCEGTRLGSHDNTTEAEAYSNCLKAVRAADGQLVIADFAPRNVERLESFLAIAQATGRRLLVQPRDAYLLRAMHLADPVLVADGMADQATGLYDDPKVKPSSWEGEVRDLYRKCLVGHCEVAKDPGAYILAMSLTDVADLLDIRYLLEGRTRGLYLFSNSQAYDDEQTVDLARLWNWANFLGLRVVGLEPPARKRGKLSVRQTPGYHASGHAPEEDLVTFVKAVRPKILIPIHTEAPGRWQELLHGTGIRVRLPQVGQPLVLR